MFKSKSDIARIALVSMALTGCDSMQVPEPVSTTTPLRAAFMGVVIPGQSLQVVWFSRPITNDGELSSNLEWFDRQESWISIVDPSRIYRVFESNNFASSSGLRADTYLDTWPDSGVHGLRGVLKWNASAPFSLAAGNTVVDSFDLRPEVAESVEFRSGMVRGDVGLRWPRLAAVRSESLLVWSRKPDSVVAFLEDWRILCNARGLPSERVMVLNRMAIPATLEWKIPDTTTIRGIMSGTEEAQTIFAIGDSIWIPKSDHADIYLGLSHRPEYPVWGRIDMLNTSVRMGLRGESFTRNPLIWSESEGMIRFDVSGWGPGFESTIPIRMRFQVTTVCPSVLEWRQYGSTDRMHRPRGNVAPFDGYFCQLSPDTVSFPRGDVILVPPDTMASPKNVIVVSKPLDTTTVIHKVNP